METSEADCLDALRLHLRFAGRVIAGVMVFGAGFALRAAPKEDWLPVSPEELKATASQLEPEAAAEVLFRKVEIDDRDFPQERVTREYIRYKVFRPEQIDAVTRLAVLSGSSDSQVKLRGRLTLPDGRAKIFGEESIRERAIAQSAAEKNLLTRLLGSSMGAVKEQFLAISGVEPGAVLEYRVERTDSSRRFLQGFPLQTPNLAVRLLEYRVYPASKTEWDCRYFVLHKSTGGVTLDHDKKKNLITITATNLPSLPQEPLMAVSSAARGLYFLLSYDKFHVDYLARKSGFGDGTATVDPRKTGPWSPFATRSFMMLDDRIELTTRIRELAVQLTSGIDQPLEKARRIHRQVQALYAHFRDESKLNKTEVSLYTISGTLDDLLDYSRKSHVSGLSHADYSALAMALYQAAGFECKAIALPDHRVLPFNRQIVASVTLPVQAVAVRIDGRWIFSLPDAWPARAFGTLPWYCEGQSGLWLQAGNEEFAPVAYAGVEQNLIGNRGHFELSADGMLTGEGQRVYTGHAAETLRAILVDRDGSRQRGFFARRLNGDFRLPGSETTAAADASENPAAPNEEVTPERAVVVTKVSGVNDPDASIAVAYRLRMPGFAVVTGGRMIFRPWLFRLNAGTPFTASTRKLDVHFPYAWEELDVATIKLPPDCTPEFSEAPAGQPGSLLHYVPQLTFNAEKHQLETRREFASQVAVIPVAAYGELKDWYDRMMRGDQQEVVLNRTSAGAVAAPLAP